MNKVVIKMKPLSHFKGALPEYKSAYASGFDVRACLDKPVTLNPGERKLIPTGLSVEIPQGYELQARPRSGLALKKGLTLLNAPGTIDADYRGELKVLMINHSQEPVSIQDQDRIVQMVVAPVCYGQLMEVKKLSETVRGEGGFGSTGV